MRMGHSLAPAGIFSGGGSEVHQGRSCKGGRRVGGSGGGAPRTPEKFFKKFVKKAEKNLQLFKKFQENFAIFSKFCKILSKIWTKI